MPRFHCPVGLQTGALLELPSGAARHAQVLRLQPGDPITLFSGNPNGGEFQAQITHMGRNQVQVQIGAHLALECENKRPIHLAIGMPANDRMDWLIEKSCELGVASIQPLVTERSVLRLSGERADKKLAHWRSIVSAACEQCGRNFVPPVFPLLSLADWLHMPRPVGGQNLLLSLHADSQRLGLVVAVDSHSPVTFLSGPEGGFTKAEETLALANGFQPVTLGPRVLRSETAPLAALAALTLLP